MRLRSRPLLIGIVLALAACDSGESALDGRVYLPAIPRDEVIGSWAPRSHPPTLLQSFFGTGSSLGLEVLALRSGEDCEITRGLAQRFIRCELAYVVETQAKARCTWRIEGSPDAESLYVVFRGRDGKTWAAKFGVFRHTTDRDIALLGTCAVGNAYGLFRQDGHAR